MTQSRDVWSNFRCGKLSAFARLGSLCDLDLNLVSVYQILRGHTKPSGGDLLDSVYRLRLEIRQQRIFTAFTGIAARAQAIHRDRQCPVSFHTYGAQRHGLRAETLKHLRFGFHLGEIHWIASNKVEKIADRDRHPRMSHLFDM